MAHPVYNQNLDLIGILAQSGTPTDCIVFTGETSDFTLKATYKEWNGTVEYSTDHNTWTVWDGSEISSSGKKLYLRGSGNTTFCTQYGARFVLSARAGCSGNLNTLLEYSDPPTTLNASCYFSMFNGCTSLTTAPALPATTLADHCYYYMFYGCTSLTTAPALPATSLAPYCYYGIFQDCTSLTTAPALPATILADYCYSSMFYGCINLTTAPAALSATTLASYCYQYMFYGCKSLTTAPALPATTLADSCYIQMFYRCTSLTTAPALPATILADYCYTNMFNGCTAFKVSSTKTGTYQYAWRIPTSGTISSTPSPWDNNMLKNTGGTFTSDPSINTTYYVENEPV